MVNGKKKSQKEFDEQENIDQKYYCSNYYDVRVNKYGVKCETSLTFRENKGCISSIDPYGWFSWYFRYQLGRRSLDDKKLKGKLVNMIKDVNGKFDDYSISPKIRQILLHWVMNQLKVICYDWFYNRNIFLNNFCSYKNELLFV